jgi:16S rRNA (guanine1207-N2)-methyltransferase
VEHYFSAEPSVPSSPRTVTVRLRDQTVVLRTDRGVFASAGLDPGTEALLREAPRPPPAGTMLDLGCGHGLIAVALARRSPGARVVAVDVNHRALELTRTNAAANGVSIEVLTPDEVDPSLRFTAIYSNPPVRVGREALARLLSGWIARLEADGAAYLVIHRHLGADSMATRLGAAGLRVRRLGSKRGYRVLEVRAGPPASHHP